MKSNIVKFWASAALLLVSSCAVSTQTNVPSPDEVKNAKIIGSVRLRFQSFTLSGKKAVANEAYERLKKKAIREFYPKNVDVVNVSTLYEFTDIVASGDVILVGSAAQVQEKKTSLDTSAHTGMDAAIKNAVNKLMADLPKGASIAVVSISSSDSEISSLVISELEFHLVSAKRFTIVDRSTLDLIQNEQNFHMSGAVNDADVVKIGALSGANVVIAGSLIKSGSSNRVSLKALDVKTGQIIAMARESY